MAPNTRDLIGAAPGHGAAVSSKNGPATAPASVVKPSKVNLLQVLENEEIVKDNKSRVDRKEVLYDGHFYDVTDFVGRHPGGGIIEFYTRSKEDATLAIQQFHARSFGKVTAIMKQFKRRSAKPTDSIVPTDPETVKKHEAMTKDFVDLYRELESEGFFEPSLIHTTYRCVELLTFFFVAAYLLLPYGQQSISSTVVGVILFAIFGARSGYLGHEGGHRSLTGDRKIDGLIQAFSFGFGTGLSGAAWNSQHFRHHDMPQRLHRDHDLDTLPLMAFNAKVLEEKKEEGRNFFVKNQAILSVTIDTMVVLLAWKFWIHPQYAYKKKKYLELFCMCVHHLYVSLFIGFWPYVFSLYLGSIYLFGNYVLSHSHLPVTEGPMHWVEYALIHTQDIDDSWWCNWWMGYLNFQIEHHLFPTMPQFRNRRAKERVKVLAAKHGIPYLCSSYKNIVIGCLKNLQQVSEHLRDEI